MADFEIERAIMAQNNLRYICGIDEAGRGPWAGPVVAAAIILPQDGLKIGVNDSKKLSHKLREEYFHILKETSIAYNIAFIDAKEIDEINILQATYLAMRKACNGLSIEPEYALVDGNRDPILGIRTKTIIKGDSISQSIAAASILAKVARDQYMDEMDALYPEYGFAKHKGYGVPAHIEALKKYGPCPLHRTSFKPIKELLPK